MNFYSQKDIKNLLTEYDTSPKKTLGQNFLINQKILEKIIKSAELIKNDTVLEVGPGIGTLTNELAKTVKKVVAVEKDKKMVEALRKTLKEYKNIEIIQADILQHNYSLPTTNYKLVANIPYYLTSALIRKFLEEKNQPELMVLMIQKEVAQRICAKPPNMSLLAVSVQFYAEPKIISYVKKENFWPSPNVDSAIIKITPKTKKSDANAKDFFNIVKAGFSQPRKQLANNLSKSLKISREQAGKWLLANNIKPEQRAETLNISDWQGLTRTLNSVS